MMDQPEMTFLMLTKCPERMVEMMRVDSICAEAVKAPNIWWGVTVMRQADVETRLSILAQGLPLATRKWVSVEPILEEIDLRGYTCRKLVDAVVAGPETGPGARLCEPGWLWNLENDCVMDRVPFWRKGWRGKQKRPWGM